MRSVSVRSGDHAAGANDFKMQRSFSASGEEEEEEELEPVTISRIFKLNSPEWPFILLGSIGAIFSGAIQPAFAVIFAEVLGVSIP